MIRWACSFEEKRLGDLIMWLWFVFFSLLVGTPNMVERQAILNVHVSKKGLLFGEDVHLANIASMTTGFTGADLAKLVNEAVLFGGKQNKVVAEKIDFIEAVERSIVVSLMYLSHHL